MVWVMAMDNVCVQSLGLGLGTDRYQACEKKKSEHTESCHNVRAFLCFCLDGLEPFCRMDSTHWYL